VLRLHAFVVAIKAKADYPISQHNMTNMMKPRIVEVEIFHCFPLSLSLSSMD
jgi:hypothetical protein